MAAQEIYEVKLIGSVHNQVFNQVWHLRQFGTEDPHPEDAANEAQSWIALILKDIVSNEVTYSYSSARQLTPEPGDSVLSTASNNEAGAIVENALPSFCAMVVQQRTGFSSRRKRGRSYIPGVPVTYEDDSQLTGTALTAVQNKLDQILAHFVVANSDFELGVYSKTEAAESVDPYAGFTPITAMNINPIIGTQRRRRIGHGS